MAWCCLDAKKIYGWANENLLSGNTAEIDAAAALCGQCKMKSSFFSPLGKTCVKHCPAAYPPLTNSEGKRYAKIPAAAAVKADAAMLGADKAALKTKESALTYLAGRRSFPIVKAKSVKSFNLNEIHDGIRRMVNANRDLFASCDTICLENQPSHLSPSVKSVQILLFATLRDLLPGPPTVRLVHASKKGGPAGEGNYVERKSASEARVTAAFEEGLRFRDGDPRTAAWFEAQKKRSDLADCLCMCLDASPSPTPAQAQG